MPEVDDFDFVFAVKALDAVDRRAGAEVGSADAADDEDVEFLADALGGLLDAREFLLVVSEGVIGPAEEVVAGEGTRADAFVDFGDFLAVLVVGDVAQEVRVGKMNHGIAP